MLYRSFRSKSFSSLPLKTDSRVIVNIKILLFNYLSSPTTLQCHPGMSPASLGKSSTQGSLYEQGYPVSPVSQRRREMEVVFTHGAGLDGHQKSVTACRLISDSTGQAPEGVAELRTFGTMTIE